jgi:long-subunit fatty acid transport protein
VLIGGLYELTDRVRLLGRFNWYGWSSFEEIRVVPDNGQPPQVDPQNFENTIGLAAGLEWQVMDGLRLRGGFQYDQTPTRDRFRNTRIPDADRYLLAAGFTYDLTDNIQATFGYLHVFVANAYEFPAGHTVRLELVGDSFPTFRDSNGTFTVTVRDATLSLPTRGGSPAGAFVE